MAKVKGPLNSIQAGGTVNNVVYARNHYGAYTRSWASPVQPDTAEQLAWRAAMQTVQSTWKDPASLTTARLSAWENFANTWPRTDRWGNPAKLNAKEWFTRFNLYRARKGIFLVTDPPLFPSTTYYPSIDFYWDSSGIFMEVWIRPEFQEFVLVSYTGPHNHTRNFAPQSTTFGAFYDSTTGGPIKIVDSSLIDTDPHNWFFRVVTVDTWGRPSNKVWFKVFTNGTAPVSKQNFSRHNVLSNNNPTTVILNGINAENSWNGSQRRVALNQIDTTSWSYTEVEKSWLYFFFDSTTVGDSFLYDTLQSWVPAETTYNEYSIGNAWASPGGLRGTDYAQDAFASIFVPGLSGFWWRVEITDQMNAWLSGGIDPIEFWYTNDPSVLRFYRYDGIGGGVNLPFVLNVPVVT